MRRWPLVLRIVRRFGWRAGVGAMALGVACCPLAGAQTGAQTTVTGSVSASPDPTGYDDGFAITATVMGSDGGAYPTGSVTLSVGGTQVASGVVLVNGVATYSVNSVQLAALNVGTYAVTGTYSGDTNYLPATLNAGSITVTQVATQTTLINVVSPIFYGETIADAATEEVSPNPDAGTLDFLINGTVTCVLDIASVNNGGSDSCASQHTGEGYSVGNYLVQSVYSGDTNFTTSSSPVYPVVIQPDPTATTTASSLNPSLLGESVTFTSSIVDLYATGQGTVNFFDGATMIGSATANALGQATLSTSSLAIGPHTITSCLVASLNFLASSPCGAVTQVVNAPPSPFLLTVNPTALSVGVGNSVMVQVTVTPLGGFSEPVELGCGGLPHETSCTFVQTTIGAGGGTTTLIVSPAAPHNCGASAPDFIAPNVKSGMAGLMLSVLAMVGLRRRRRWMQGLGLVMALCVLPWLGGCGSGCKDFGTEPTNYTFTVTGSSMGSPVISHAVTVTLNVHL